MNNEFYDNPYLMGINEAASYNGAVSPPTFQNIGYGYNQQQVYQQPYDPSNPYNMGYNSIPNCYGNNGYGYNQQQNQYNYGGYNNQYNYNQQQQFMNPYDNNGYGYNQQQNQYGYNNYTNTNYYNGTRIYDAYESLRMEEQLERQRKEYLEQQYKIDCMLAKSASTFLGREIVVQPYYYDDEKSFKEKYPEIAQRIDEIRHYNYLAEISYNAVEIQEARQEAEVRANLNRLADIQEQQQKLHKPDISFYDYMETAGELYALALEADQRKLERQYDRLYDQQAFQDVLKMHRNNNFLNMFKKEQSKDEINISLPENLKTAYFERRQKFLASIMGG